MTRADPGGGLVKLIQALIAAQSSGMSVGFPARVLKFTAGRADVQPLIRQTDEDPPPIHGVPVFLGGRYINPDGTEYIQRPSLHPGDVVFCVCADYEIKNGLAGQPAEPDSVRTHSLNDAVIVAMIAPAEGDI